MVLKGLMTSDAAADRVVPPSGYTARLTMFSAATMAFLAVFALALSLSAGRVAQEWGEALARSSTLRISAAPEELSAQTAAALRVLETTPGVEEARPLSAEEQQALLEPWFGPDLPVDTLPMPQLIDIVETPEGYDSDGLRLRLSAEVPGAVLDDHTRWRRPLVAAASRLRLLGWVSIGLIAAATGAMITLAANAALAANAKVITVLRLVGATDAYIAGAFVRRFTLRTLGGAALGTALAIGAILVLPDAGEAGGFLAGIGFQGWHWILPLVVPPLAALVALYATQAAAQRVLKELT
ncbi:cell division transport system permease protein [Puniceibacterium sediminis]|uniref:Cell division transport system permease protein n=2 Tax=Puniceibacterium sediminis TaxID=1608407 RepID=A0A238WML4_9RHOB|nr:FtsX-like permease family protein [Puniceibacterium sediminis]SNR46929.1 cell division transport system permease protein [Puniceibacterium sediminis]